MDDQVLVFMEFIDSTGLNYIMFAHNIRKYYTKFIIFCVVQGN